MADAAVTIDASAIGTPAYLDLALSPGGDLQLTAGTDAVRQALTLRLLASVEDFFLDMDAGVPWHDGLFNQRQGLTPAFEALLQNTILATPGILGLVSWAVSYNRAARTLNLKFEAQASNEVVSFSLPISATGQAQ